jgi:hypothetical protein
MIQGSAAAIVDAASYYLEWSRQWRAERPSAGPWLRVRHCQRREPGRSAAPVSERIEQMAGGTSGGQERSDSGFKAGGQERSDSGFKAGGH